MCRARRSNFTEEDISELKDFVTSFFVRHKKDITKRGYLQFYIFECPYNKDSGMWSIQLGVSSKATLYCRPEDYLITRIDAQTILDSFKKSGAIVTMANDYVWRVIRLI